MTGCECLDRDFASFEEYREFLPPLGIRKIRLQAGWAKCEKVRGVYDFKWLDDIVDWVIAPGPVRCQVTARLLRRYSPIETPKRLLKRFFG